MGPEEKQNALNSVYADLPTCMDCRLAGTRIQAVRGEGDPNSRLFLIALSPGSVEDEQGRMFIGPSGRILDKLFNAAQIRRDQVYMTDLVKCMLPKSRRPASREIESCKQYLLKEIAIIQPDIIVPLGYYATKTIFRLYNVDAPAAHKEYAQFNGKLLSVKDMKIYPLAHPSSLLYHPAYEVKTTTDYRNLSVLLHECKYIADCPLNGMFEKEWQKRFHKELFCKGLWSTCSHFQKQEFRSEKSF